MNFFMTSSLNLLRTMNRQKLLHLFETMKEDIIKCSGKCIENLQDMK